MYTTEDQFIGKGQIMVVNQWQLQDLEIVLPRDWFQQWGGRVQLANHHLESLFSRGGHLGEKPLA